MVKYRFIKSFTPEIKVAGKENLLDSLSDKSGNMPGKSLAADKEQLFSIETGMPETVIFFI
ncbi:MAG: hypothetical protein HC867_08880 [Bacteroidia bacterium]|nr:hypothetical protein [Bacteroidia bacterium]